MSEQLEEINSWWRECEVRRGWMQALMRLDLCWSLCSDGGDGHLYGRGHVQCKVGWDLRDSGSGPLLSSPPT